MNIFVVHASHRLTDRAAHGDGLIAWGFIKALAHLGNRLWVAAPCIDVGEPNVRGVELFELRPRFKNKSLRLIDYSIRSRMLYERLSKSVRFDVIHQLNPVVRGYSFGMVGAKVPVFLGPYNGDWPDEAPSQTWVQNVRRSSTKALRVLIDMLMQKQARGLLITTPYALNRLPGVSKRSSQLFVVPNGIDTNAFRPSTVDASRQMLQILMVGNAAHKGIFTMLAAFEVVAAAVPDVELVIAGGGSHVAEVKQRVGASLNRTRYNLIGDVDRNAMPAIIREAAVVCVPSFGEPFGMIVLEAMATGKPVVGTRAGGIPYLLGSDSPLLFAPGDSAALACILIDLLKNDKLRSQIGADNRRLATELFTWDAVGRQLESAYASVVI